MGKTVVKSKLKGNRNDHEYDLLNAFRDAVPHDCEVAIVGDRGFFDQEFLTFIQKDLGFDYIIRARKDISVTSESGERRAAGDWVSPSGGLCRLPRVRVTIEETLVGLFVALHDKDIKAHWLVMCSRADWTGSEVKRRYGKRFICEETFRDCKDLLFGMGMSWGTVTHPERRDRMMLLATLAHTLLSTLGASGEDVGLDKLLKSNTAKRIALSTFRQGCRWYVFCTDDAQRTPPEADDRIRCATSDSPRPLPFGRCSRGMRGWLRVDPMGLWGQEYTTYLKKPGDSR